MTGAAEGGGSGPSGAPAVPAATAEDPAYALARVEAALAARMPARMVPDLDRISDLVDVLGQPQRSYPSIHITGTNGKTSTARMIDALLRAFGLRTGRYTSPHLESVTERISLDGSPLAAEQFAGAYDDVAPYVDLVDARHAAAGGQQVTYHELLTAMAFAAFADAPVDVAVVEVGMGGSWDATNVLDAPVAVITPVALDHTDVLGPTLTSIAREKSGIIAAGATLVTAVQEPAVADVLLRRAVEMDASVAREGADFGVRDSRLAVGGQLITLGGLGGEYEEIFLPLFGIHQARNAACALAAVEVFLGAGPTGLDRELVRAAFAGADSPGRLEIVRTSPTVLLDGAHNPAGARALAAALTGTFQFTRLIGVLGVLADKDTRGVLAELEPLLSAVVCTQTAAARAMSADALGALAVEIFGLDRVSVAPRLDDALAEAVALAEEGGDMAGVGVLVTGSLVTVGEARRLLRGSRG